MLKSTLILLVWCTIFQLSFSPNHQFPPHMNSRTCSLFSKFNLFFTHILLVLFQSHYISSSRDDKLYRTCGNAFSCGDKITGIEYPFRGAGDPPYCGHPDLMLSCDFEQNITTIDMVNVTYRVLEIHQTEQIMRIVREDIVGRSCPVEMINTTLDHSLFDYTDACTNLTFLYGCNWTSWNVPGLVPTPCQSKGHHVYALPGTQGPGICDASVVVPVLGNGAGGFVNATALYEVVKQGFEIMWNIDSQACRDCTGSDGRCGYDIGTNQTTCFCPDPPYVSGICPIANRTSPGINRTGDPPYVPAGNRSNSRAMYIGIPVAGALLASVALAFLVFYCKKRRKLRGASNSAKILSKEITPPPSSQSLTTPASTAFTRSIPSYSSPSCNLGNVSCYFGAKLFDYTELEEATHNFNASRELGDGAFGVVYYGELSDGRKVAVKRLYENNFRRVEQFMNEVEILTRLRHDNLVTLHGCTSRRSRELLLVYEYIPNGTVGDHLHGKQAKSGLLSWPVRLNIAIETAEALTYLHKSGIVHRDVKTNNILLDNDFHVKVADFGLSRLFPTNATHVSTAPQGTPGYVDPEYYQCYQLTEKSDVYSFGVVLIELISSLPAVDTNRHRHDINLGNMAMNRIQDNKVHELVDRSLGFETNSMVRRMATSVVELAFRCLQQEREVRPLMDEVLEGLREITTNEDLNTINVAFVDILVDENAAPSKEGKTK